MESERGSADPVQELSAALFGRTLRLPLAIWVRSRTEPFFQRQASDGVAVAQTHVRKELATFVQLGMLRELPRAEGDKRLFYEQDRGHPLWGTIDAAQVAVHALHRENRL
ncbi:hypothetical protein [Nocardia salmonicida]|uniref:hypothetical protein n=1 Tax=Nocardia salmonicida TaxID=53431 RepID=UPI0007A41F8E|nr:hypothetical protein [Nocardia salmonicida]